MNGWLDDAFYHWEGIIRENRILHDDIVIVHFAGEIAFLGVLLAVSKRMNDIGLCRNVYVLCVDKIWLDLIDGNEKYIRPVMCELDVLQEIAGLYRIVPFFERLYFDSYSMAADSDLMVLRGLNGITDEEMACIAVYNRPELLDMKDFSEKCKRFEAGFVDWDRLDFGSRYAGCISYEDIINRLKKEELNKDSEIMIFATTVTARKLRKLLKEYRVIAFLDNDSQLEGMDMEGVPIHTPDHLLERDGDTRILVASRHYREICEQLSAMGYVTGEQVFPVHDAVLKEVSFASVKENTKDKIKRGRIIYDLVRREHKTNNIYINPHTGTGDVYFSWLYTDMREAVLLVPTENCKKLAEALGIFAIHMTIEDISALVAYGRYTGMDETGIKVLNYSFDQFVTAKIRGYKGLDYNTMLQRTVFDADSKAVPKRIPQGNSDALFDSYRLQKQRTILLSPYAGHAEDIPKKFWESLATWLKEKDYDVCTNINGDEREIEGTLGVRLDYSEVLDFTDKAGTFIGLRSGLCDLLSTTTAKMIIIYPDQMFSKVVDYYHYFSLELMGMRKNNLMELIWNKDDPEYYVREIDKYLG